MNSCLYECDIMHIRIKPKRHRFSHRIFMFYLDLDEIDDVCKKTGIISRNRWNLFSFYDADHLTLSSTMIRKNVLYYLSSVGIREKVGRIMILTNLRVLGYVFNPVSFYFCFDPDNRPICVVPEIGNTFGEIKPFVIGRDAFKAGVFDSQQIKHYYISPFADLDVSMHFRLRVPDDGLDIKIDDVKDGEKFLFTTMTGPREELTASRLWWYLLRFPFVTLKVIGLIHIHALILFLKGIPHHAKEANMHLQKGVYRAWVKK